MRALMPLATLVCLLMSLPLLGTLVRGESWWLPAACLMATVAGVSALYRLSGWNSAPVPVLQTVAVVLLVIPLFAAHAAPLGIVPSPAAVTHVIQVFEQGLDSINTSSPPASASSGIMLIIALTFAVFTIVADFLAVTARCAGMVGGLLLALMVIPLVVDDSGLTLGQAVSTAAGFLLLLAVDMWVRGRDWGVRVPDGHDSSSRFLSGVGRALTVSVASAAAILMATTLPLTVPSLSSDPLYSMADGTYVGTSQDVITSTHPLVSLHRDLVTSSDDTVLTYRTDQEEPDYLRTFVLDEFDGENWTMHPVDASEDSPADDDLPLPTGWMEEPAGATSTTRVTLGSDTPGMEFLPLPYWAREVDVNGDWYVDPDSHMVFTTETPPDGLSFTVETAERTPSAQELSEAGNPRSLPADYLDLPADVDQRVQTLTDSVTSEAGSAYERAVALQEFFTGGNFTYTLEPAAAPDGADPLTHFLLEDRVGYCEQFAGAMAVMARQADIPSRVAVGYTAGEQVGQQQWAVSGGDAHAWPELYFEGAGWVRFEPTPAGAGEQGSATVPDYTDGAEGSFFPSETEPPSDEPTEPSESPEEEPSPSESESPEAPEEDTPEDATSTAGEDTPVAGPDMAWLPYVGGGLGGLLLLALSALIRSLVRWSRLASLTPVSAHTAWRELRDTCLDLGVDWDLTESPRSTAERLALRGPASEEARAALWRLALAEESARYAPVPAEAEHLRADLCSARASLVASVGGGARVRGVLLPRSLAPSRRPRPAPAAATTTAI